MADLGDYGGESGYGGGVASGSDFGGGGFGGSEGLGSFFEDTGSYAFGPSDFTGGFSDFNAEPSPDFSDFSFDQQSPGLMDRFRDFYESKFGKFARTMIGASTNVDPAVKAASNMLGVFSKAGQGNKEAGKAIGGWGGALAGGLIGGPPGAAIGYYGGGKLGESLLGGVTANKGMTGGAATPAPESNGLFDAALGTLGGLYANNQIGKSLGSQQASLSGLYGQDSPYAQTLRQQLERRDAAGGRRSQYGPREVELQAALAGNAARLAPQQMQLAQMQNARKLAMLRMLGTGYQKAGGLSGIMGGLSGLFGGGGGGGYEEFGGATEPITDLFGG